MTEINVKTLPSYEVCTGCKKVMVKTVYKEFDYRPVCANCRNKPITKGGVKKTDKRGIIDG